MARFTSLLAPEGAFDLRLTWTGQATPNPQEPDISSPTRPSCQFGSADGLRHRRSAVLRKDSVFEFGWVGFVGLFSGLDGY